MIRSLLSFLVVAALGACTARDEESRPGPPRLAIARDRTAAGILGTILRENADFARAHDQRHFDRFRDMQHPRATVVACSDSRFHDNALEREADDDLFVIEALPVVRAARRTAGLPRIPPARQVEHSW
jgi:hypothetical protein